MKFVPLRMAEALFVALALLVAALPTDRATLEPHPWNTRSLQIRNPPFPLPIARGLPAPT